MNMTGLNQNLKSYLKLSDTIMNLKGEKTLIFLCLYVCVYMVKNRAYKYTWQNYYMS